MNRGIFAAAVITAAIIIAIALKSEPSLDSRAKQFCGETNVATARVCGGYIEVVSSLLGGGSKYYAPDGSVLQCPVVSLEYMSPDCRRIYDAKLNSSISCRDVCIKVTDFESCAAAGYPVMESYPRQCRAGGKTYTEKISAVTECLPGQRNADVCTKEYQPVCAKVNVQCIRAPCNPVNETFGNSCEACKNPNVESYVTGECS